MEVTIKLTEPKEDSWNISYSLAEIQAQDVKPVYILCNPIHY